MRSNDYIITQRTGSVTTTAVVTGQMTSPVIEEMYVFSGGRNYAWNGSSFVPSGDQFTDAPDVVTAKPNDDYLFLGGGDDTAFGGDGVLLGGFGDDVLTGGGQDTFNGLDGDDVLDGDGDDDFIEGGAGRDFIKAGAGRDTTHGVNGDDLIFDGVGSDILEGPAGNDLVRGGVGYDFLVGGSMERQARTCLPAGWRGLAVLWRQCRRSARQLRRRQAGWRRRVTICFAADTVTTS